MSGHAVVVGAGLTGLALAHALRARGVAVTVVEERAAPGGNLRTRIVENAAGRWLLEQGPNSFGDAQAPIMGLVAAAGLSDRLVKTTAEAERRWVWRAGALREVPSNPLAFLTSSLLPPRPPPRGRRRPSRSRRASCPGDGAPRAAPSRRRSARGGPCARRSTAGWRGASG